MTVSFGCIDTYYDHIKYIMLHAPWNLSGIHIFAISQTFDVKLRSPSIKQSATQQINLFRLNSLYFLLRKSNHNHYKISHETSESDRQNLMALLNYSLYLSCRTKRRTFVSELITWCDVYLYQLAAVIGSNVPNDLHTLICAIFFFADTEIHCDYNKRIFQILTRVKNIIINASYCFSSFPFIW